MNHVILASLLCVQALVAASPLFAEMVNADFSQTEEVDNLWDGVNRNGEVQVFSLKQNILVDGSSERSQQFGASPRVADIDGDRKNELVVGDANGFVWVYELGPAKPNRTVSPGKFHHTYFGDCATVSLHDWNRDSLQDLICGNNLGMMIACKNRGGNVFITDDGLPSFTGHKEAFPYVNTGTTPIDIGNYSAPYVVDWDGDGKQDLVVGEGSYSANSVYLYRNIGSAASPEFSKKQRYWLAYGTGREQLVPAVGDIDGDGDPDVVVGERLGYVNLYVNEPGRTADKKEKYLLRHSKVFTFGDKEIPVGPMVRPELTDWDGDGDLDLLLGAMDGRVYLATNNGTLKAPEFGPPTPLRSAEQLKPYRKPVAWRVEYAWFPTPSHRNSGAYMHMMSETNEVGEVVDFVRYEFADGYVGSFPKILSSGHTALDCGKSHTLVIDCRAKNVDCSRAEFEHYETAQLSADTKKETWRTDDVPFKAGGAWQKVRKTIRFHPAYKENRGKMKSLNKWLRLYIEGKKDMQFDVRSIEVR